MPFGYNIGLLVASGSVKARQQATARTWRQAKQCAVSSYSGTAGAQDPPRERMAATLVAMSGTSVATIQFDFTYSYRYAAGLTGLWPGGLAQ